jgi:hypothetical protein
MNQTSANPTPDADVVTARARGFVALWAALLVALFVVAGVVLASGQHRHKLAAVEQQAAQIDPQAVEPGLTAADSELPEGAHPVEVTTGIYVERIIAVSIKDFEWKVEFYIWFRWEGDQVRLEDGFEVVDGGIESVKKEREHTDGESHYELYRIVAQITKFFDVARFPRDDHLLTINIETPAYRRGELLFCADTEGSAVSSRVRIPGYSIDGMVAVEKPHAYKTGRGDPRISRGTRTTHSQFRCGIKVGRPDAGLYVKMFQALFVACGIALLALFIKPTDVDPRFGLGVGGLFAGVANSYITSALIPDTGVMTLADLVNGVGIAVILLSIVESTISLYLYDRRGREALSRLFDRVSFWILAFGAVAVNAALFLAAA